MLQYMHTMLQLLIALNTKIELDNSGDILSDQAIVDCNGGHSHAHYVFSIDLM